MSHSLHSISKRVSLLLGAVTLTGVGLLFVQDVKPGLFPSGSHDALAAFPLAMIALAYLVYQFAVRPTWMEFARAAVLATAFLFWAGNQYWSNLPQATLFNDVAIALFVFDVFLILSGGAQL